MMKSFKNYGVLFLMFVCVIALLIYIKMWSTTYKNDKYSKSYLTDLVQEVKFSEIEASGKEMNDVFLLITKTNDKTIYKREKKVYSYLKSVDLIDNFIYLDVSNEIDYLSKLNGVFGDFKVSNEPILLFIKNGKVVSVIDDFNKIDDIKKEYQL